MKGHIKITDKVYFKPEGLPKPNPFPIYYTLPERKEFNKKMEAYEASKKTVEVSNVSWSEIALVWKFGFKVITNNQECEAEVTDTAIITKI